MSFQSAVFPLFLTAAVLIFHALPRRARPEALLAFSYLFYGLWSVRYALLLFAATLVSFLAARRIESAKKRAEKKRALACAMAASLGVLVVFKYTSPLLAAAAAALPSIKESMPAGALSLAAPIGISYYTFRIIGYVFDVYWEKIPAEKSFTAYAAYVAFFPHILSGPIQRAGDFLAQLRNSGPIRSETISSGLRLILFGFFKKLVVADPLGLFVGRVLSQPEHYYGPLVLLGCYGFVFQLYADFSGFTDIARGSSRLFGIESPKNFDSPFYSMNIQEFWRKWHMSLTTWLADYVFMPLRMATRSWGQAGLLLSITVNMTAIGIWHGATWNFLAFGLLHSAYLCVSVLTLGARDEWFGAHPRLAALRRFTAPLITFHMWTLTSLVFWAPNLKSAANVLANLWAAEESRAGLFFFGKKKLLWIGAMIVVMEAVHLAQTHGKLRWLLDRPRAARWAAYYAAIAAILFLGRFQSSSFIYFQF